MAKKKYYQGKKGRMDESNGMSLYEKHKRMERDFAGMIKEDRSAPANLPQEKIMKYYPDTYYARSGYLDDTIGMVDYQIDQDASAKDIKRGPYPEKY